jgi:polyferredoxin
MLFLFAPLKEGRPWSRIGQGSQKNTRQQIASAILLWGTPSLAQMLPILLGGAFFFVFLVPGALFWSRPKSDQPHPTKEAGQIPVI